MGHYKNKCLELQVLVLGIQINIDKCNKEHALFYSNDGYDLIQKQEKGVQGILSPYHAFIDMCTSYASTLYPHLLTNLKNEKCRLIGHSNAGSCGKYSSGEMGALKQMWMNKDRVATIILLKLLKKLWEFTYDYRLHSSAFVFHTDNGNIILCNNKNGMPYLNLRELEAKAALSLVQTMQGNMEWFTKHEVEEARKARKAQAMLGHPTDQDFLGMVCGSMISDCPMSANAVTMLT
jgi:hypothetical protein